MKEKVREVLRFCRQCGTMGIREAARRAAEKRETARIRAERARHGALTEAERKEAALFEAERMALLQVPRTAKVIMIDRYTVEKGGKLYGVCTVTTEENIGYTQEIT